MAKGEQRLIDIDHPDTVLKTFILFVQTADAVSKYADSRFYKAGLSTIKFMILRILAFNGGSMTPSEIAQWTLRERHNITTLVDRLKREGFVSAERNDKDRRVVNVALTNKGREVLAQGTPVAREIVKQVMLSITESEAASLARSLRVLRQNARSQLKHIAEHSKHRHD
jgi:MarR family 2-MHQ and catechol resistance regulon transcriptional repressor